MKEKIINVIFVISFILLGGIVGWMSNDFYEYEVNERKFDGLSIRNANYSSAIKVAKEKDSMGDWVCINIQDMSYERAFDVCVHECSHQAYSEIFAEKCEDDFIGCRDLIENS